MLFYSSPRLDFIWVPVEDEFGDTELVEVTFVYPPLPYSCSHYREFGRSFSRGVNNPNAVNPFTKPSSGGVSQATTKAPRKGNQTQAKQRILLEEANINNVVVGEENKGNGDINPMVVDEFLGCDVVLDADQTLADVQNGDDLDNFDIIEGNIQIDVAILEMLKMLIMVRLVRLRPQWPQGACAYFGACCS